MKTLKTILTILVVCLPFTANAQFMMFGGNRANQDSLRQVTATDYADMLAKVGVGQPREGRQPNNPDASKHPNYDELVANPYPFYPDPLNLRVSPWWCVISRAWPTTPVARPSRSR